MTTLADVSNLRIEVYSDHPEVYAFADWKVEDYLATQQRRRDVEAHKPKQVWTNDEHLH